MYEFWYVASFLIFLQIRDQLFGTFYLTPYFTEVDRLSSKHYILELSRISNIINITVFFIADIHKLTTLFLDKPPGQEESNQNLVHIL